MIRRVVVLGSIAATVLVAALLASVPTAGQSATPAARAAATSWTVPRTPSGHPDLQGIWTTDEEIGVPMERLAAFGYNLLNGNTITSIFTTYGPAWRRPSAIQGPRLFKVGMQLDF